MPRRKRSVPVGQASLPVEDYRHEGAKRPNNPPAAIAAEGRTPPVPKPTYAYSPRLDPKLRFDSSGRADALPPLIEKAMREPLSREEAALLAEALRRHEPWLEWAGKRELPGFAVDPVALHIHERVSTQAILRAAARQDITRDLFADPQLDYAQAVRFYQHDVDWANRLILGDSLQVMASLAQREGLAGKVQMIYIDPPYGIRFGSNFQPETGRRTVSDKEADLTREPEMVRAYRDTWRLGVHSYLAYLRDRLIVARTLLAETGSIFVQIGDENVHRVRALMDEVFGADNFVALITIRKTGGLGSDGLTPICDFLLWYARDKSGAKFRRLFVEKHDAGTAEQYGLRLLPSGELRTQAAGSDGTSSAKWVQATAVHTMYAGVESCLYTCTFDGKTFRLPPNRQWSTTLPGMTRIHSAGRLYTSGDSLRLLRRLDDYPVSELTSLWSDVMGTRDKLYSVQTNAKIVERCLLMTTDPGDLVLDPTCGSGTTAYVAEQWGRRWITIDTSRVAIAIARQRLMTARFEHYRLKDETKGVAGGFVCKTVPHITLRSIANNTALDPIFAKHEPILEARLAELNEALKSVDQATRARLAAKLLEKEKREGKRAITDGDRRRWLLPPANRKGVTYTTVPMDFPGWYHWEVPFDTDPDYPPALAAAITAYRAAWRAKQDEVDACIAAHAEQEELVDQPEVVRGITRVAGPFTVEAVQPAETSLDDIAAASPIDGAPEALEETFSADIPTGAAAEPQNAEAYLDRMLRLLKLDGVRFPDNKVSRFTRLEPLGTSPSGIHAEGRWVPEGAEDDDPEGRATVAVAFGPQYGPVTAKQVEQLIRAASRRGYDDLVIAGFAFDGAAQAIIQDPQHPDVRVHMAHIRPDVNPAMNGLIKDTPRAQLFSVFGLPRSRVERLGNGEWRVVMEGVDIYDPLTGAIEPTRQDKVAAWFLDSDYDGRTFCITQAFFPDRDAWEKLERALKGIIPAEAFEALSGTESLPFPKGEHATVAVKVIDPRGNEVMRIHRLEE
ncbi:MAG: site-specific DNA-methyltransferase [Rhodovarius sp.]|nr:site-specific DNA-methyltransferase [Rhodovarius sp.]